MGVREMAELRILEDFRARRISRAVAAKLLDCSERAVTRRAAKIRRSGPAGVKHGNYQRMPVNHKGPELREQALKLAMTVYQDFNLKHCHEYLRREHHLDVSYPTFHRWCRFAGVGRRRKRRPSSHHIARERMANEGMMLQMDGSHHKWNGKDEWCLLGLIDDATSEIPAAQFFEGETTWGCFEMLKRVIEKKGVPEIIYTDEAGWAGGSNKRPNFSQFVRACEELGIRILTTRSPESKGRIERAWRTIQGRLVPEMRHYGISGMLDANRYLQQTFLPQYWQANNTIAARNTETRYRPLAKHIDLAQVLCMKYLRVVRRDHTVSWATQEYRILDREYGALHGKEVAAHVTSNGDVSWYYGHIQLKTEVYNRPRRNWRKWAS